MKHILEYLVKFMEWYYVVNSAILDKHYGKEQEPPKSDQPRLVTQQKTARMIGICVRQVRRLMVKGILPSYQNKRNRNIRYEYDKVVEVCLKVYGRKPIED